MSHDVSDSKQLMSCAEMLSTGGGKRSSATRNPKPLLELWTSSEAQSLAGGPSADYALASCTIEDARPPPGLHGARRVYLFQPWP